MPTQAYVFERLYSKPSSRREVNQSDFLHNANDSS